MELEEEQIAEICHEANRMYCRFIGDDVAPPWPEADKEMRASAIKGVRVVRAMPHNQMPNPQEHHNLWMKDKLHEGYRYGEKMNRAEKQHPALMPYEFLKPEHRLKDTLFLSIVYCLLTPRREAQAKEEQMANLRGGPRR